MAGHNAPPQRAFAHGPPPAGGARPDARSRYRSAGARAAVRTGQPCTTSRQPRMRAVRSTRWGASLLAPPPQLLGVISARLTLKLSCERSTRYAAHLPACTSISIGGNRHASSRSLAAAIVRLIGHQTLHSRRAPTSIGRRCARQPVVPMIDGRRAPRGSSDLPPRTTAN